LLTPMLESASVVLSALILLGAGAFQFTAFKEACLSKCRTPLAFFLAEWRDGKSGALRVGFKHGSYCVGCCWALMTVMLVVGAMNLVWMAALTFFMLAEKVAPARWRLRYVAGCALMLWGLVVATSLKCRD
jgi:predicted metal-binding membrane protein